jgi:hypothetical protein
LNRCNECPLMKFYPEDFLSTCLQFTSTQTNILDDFTINYDSITNEIIDDINIPSWCGLPDDLMMSCRDTKSYVVVNDKVLINETEIDFGLDVYDSSYFKPKKEKQPNISDHLSDIITQNIKNNQKKLDDFETFTEFMDEWDGYNSYSEYDKNTKSHDVCSLCGEEDESVNRTEHNGMCNECWEYNKDNKDSIKTSYINNFRLKRGVSFTQKKFKTI